MIVGCYDLHLYCDRDDQKHPHKEFPHEFTGRNRTEATKDAARNGWLVHHASGRAICPPCRKRGLK